MIGISDTPYITVTWGQTPATDLTDYVGYYDLSNAPQGWWDEVDTPDGTKLRVAKDDAPENDTSATELAFEVVDFDSANQTGQLWFKWPGTLPATSPNDVRIYAPKASYTSYAVTDTYGRNAVWTNYLSVWHLNEDPSGTAPQFTDATGNGHDGTANGSMTSGDSVSGKLGNGVNLDGSNDYIDIGDKDVFSLLESGDPAFTAQAWSFPDVESTDVLGVISKAQEWTIATDDKTSGNSAVAPRMQQWGSNNLGNVSDSISVGSWNHYAGVFIPGTSAEAYINGVSDGGADLDSDTSPNDTDPLIIGSESTGTGYFDGVIEEARITQTELSADWVSFEYANQDDSATFWGTTTLVTPKLPDIPYITASWNNTPNTDLTDYVGYYDLSNAPQSWWDEVDTSDGTKLRVAKDDASEGSTSATELPFDIQGFDSTNQTGQLWFRWSGTLPSTSPDAVRIYPAKSSTTSYAVTDTYGRNSVWSDYLTVYHGNSLVDATGNGHDLTDNGSLVNEPGKLGGAFGFSGTSGEYFEDADADLYLDGLVSLSYSVWGKSNATNSDGGILLGETPNNHDVALTLRYDESGYEGGGSNLVKAGVGGLTDDTTSAFEGSSNTQTTNWQKIMVSWSANEAPTVYLDGTEDTPTYSDADGSQIDIDTVVFGEGGRGPWDGLVQELRMYNGVISSDWESFEYANQNDPSTFWGTTTFVPTGDMPNTPYITVPWNNTPNTDLTDYVGYYDLSNAPQSWWDEVDTSDGTKLRVAKDNSTDPTLATELPFDIQGFDSTNQTGQLWFRWSGTLPSVGADDIRIYPAKSSATSYAVTDPFGRNAVWVDYKAVYHMDGLIDATGNGNDLTVVGSPSQSTGIIGEATNFDNTVSQTANQYYDTGIIPDSLTYFSSFFNLDTVSSDWQVSGCLDSNSERFYLAVTNQNGLPAFGYDRATHHLNGNAFTAGQWRKMSMSYDSTNSTLYGYLDGQEVLNQGESDLLSGALNTIWLGADNESYDAPIDGLQDEVRISSNHVKLDYEEFAYANQNDPSTFWGTPALENGTSTSSLSVSDTGSGSDLLSTSASLSVLDVVNVSDSTAITATTTLQDSISANDSISTSTTLSVSDAGSGADVLSTSAALSVLDVVNVSDSTAITATTTLQDSISASDSISTSASLSVSDTGSGADVLSTSEDSTTITLQDSILVSDNESSGFGVELVLADSVAINDITSSPSVNLSVIDTSSTTSTLSITTTDDLSWKEFNVSTQSTLNQDATNFEVNATDNTVALQDSISANDSISTSTTLYVSDAGSGADVLSTSAALSVLDIVNVSDSTAITTTTTLQDSISVSDTSVFDMKIVNSDSISTNDAVQNPVVTLGVADSGSGMSVETFEIALSIAETATSASSITAAVQQMITTVESATGSDVVNINALANIVDAALGESNISADALLSILDTSNASDAISLSTLLQIAETATANGQLSISNIIRLLDDVSAVDSVSISTLLNILDSASTSSDIQLQSLLQLLDTSSGSDAVTTTTLLSVADSLTTTESLGILVREVRSIFDSASGSSELLLDVDLSIGDTLSVSDIIQTNVSLTIDDTSSASEVISILIRKFKTIIDSASSLSDTQVEAQVLSEDTAQGIAQPGIATKFTISDIITSDDSVKPSVQLSINDVGSSSAEEFVSSALSIVESASGISSISIPNVYFNIVDDGSGGATLQPYVELSLSDTASSDDQTSVVIQIFKVISDVINGFDQVEDISVELDLGDSVTISDQQIIDKKFTISDLANSADSIPSLQAAMTILEDATGTSAVAHFIDNTTIAIIDLSFTKYRVDISFKKYKAEVEFHEY